jgi:trehalose utilization protein
MESKVRVLVWNEFRHEKKDKAVRDVYPDGLHRAIASALEEAPDIACRTGTLDEPEQGVPEAALRDTDVLVWWGHKAHDEVDDRTVDRVHARVLEGMGFIALHSSHLSKIFRRLMGTSCTLRWRVAGERERLWNLAPGHPITAGIGDYVELPQAEMYGERFDVPEPERVVFLSWFEGGEVFRSGCCWERGHGRVFYFRPGHELYPVYHHDEIRRILRNAARWARPRVLAPSAGCPMTPPLERLDKKHKSD